MHDRNHDASNHDTIDGVAYVAHQAALVRREGQISALLADLFFQCALVAGERSIEEWDALVNAAKEAGASIADAMEFGDP